MEKKEMCFPDKFVIWKIDAGKLIQKFEPQRQDDGTLVHRSMSTVRCHGSTSLVYGTGSCNQLKIVRTCSKVLSACTDIHVHVIMQHFISLM